MTATDTAPTTETTIDQRAVRVGAWRAFRALLLRDWLVLRGRFRPFLVQLLGQPIMLLFVFAYLYPRIGNTPGGAAGKEYTTAFAAGVIGICLLYQAVNAIALPLVHEFGSTREIEDRVLAPLPVSLVAFEKVVAGALQSLFGALLVFPLAVIISAGGFNLHVSWWVLITVVPLAAFALASLALVIGTTFNPRTLPNLWSIVMLPVTFLGCTYYAWSALDPIQIDGVRWLKIVVLLNPLVYVSEGLRAALTDSDHMSLAMIYPMLTIFTVGGIAIGAHQFERRVTT
jgi:ABC-2 type transport system permease protein